jgi:hypothetical protein
MRYERRLRGRLQSVSRSLPWKRRPSAFALHDLATNPATRAVADRVAPLAELSLAW